MRFVSIVTVVVGVGFYRVAHADDGTTASDARERRGPERVSESSSAGRKEAVPGTTFVPYIGRGYVPYSYPALATCPCGSNTCYNAGRYYCGGKPYKRQWFKTWLRAHLGKGSMLAV